MHNIYKKMHNQKTNIHENINNTHRGTTPALSLNQRLSSINSNLYRGALHTILCLLFSSECFWIMLQWYNEGVYIHFPSQTLKLSNLEIKSYLPALNLLNASYLFQTRAYGSRSDTTYKRCSFIKDHLRLALQSQSTFQNLGLFLQLIFRLMCWLTCWVGDAFASTQFVKPSAKSLHSIPLVKVNAKSQCSNRQLQHYVPTKSSRVKHRRIFSYEKKVKGT